MMENKIPGESMKKGLVIIVSLVIISFITAFISGERQQNAAGNSQQGPELYKQYCLSCHQPDGNGVRGMYPPLAGNPVVTGPADKLIRIVLFGLEGPLEVLGKEYNQVMPSQDYLSDKQISSILTFLRSSWGNKADPVKESHVLKIRKAGKPQ